MAKAKKQSTSDIYGDFNSSSDIRTINDKMRKDMQAMTKREQLTELKKRSDYLCALAVAHSWKTKFGDKIDRIQETAQAENAKTTDLANRLAQQHGWAADYDAWGSSRKEAA